MFYTRKHAFITQRKFYVTYFVKRIKYFRIRCPTTAVVHHGGGGEREKGVFTKPLIRHAGRYYVVRHLCLLRRYICVG